MYTLFKILFLYRLLQDVEYSSPCYTIGPCFILHIIIYICEPQVLKLSFPSCPFPFRNHKFVYYVNLFLFYKVHLGHFLKVLCLFKEYLFGYFWVLIFLLAMAFCRTIIICQI